MTRGTGGDEPAQIVDFETVLAHAALGSDASVLGSLARAIDIAFGALEREIG